MSFSTVGCFYCGKNFLKDNRRINENKKFGHNSYCSTTCQYSAKSKKVEYTCENRNCKNIFKRQLKSVSPHEI